MIRVFTLPDLGEGLTESEIVAWHVAPGDTVTLNQHIADVETAKAVVALPSPFSGTISALHRPEGVLVHVGEPIVSFEVAEVGEVGGVQASGDPRGVDEGAETVPVTREANLVGYGPDVERAGRPKRRARTGSAARIAAAPADVTTPTAPMSRRAVEAVHGLELPPAFVGERPRCTPPVRRLARDLGVDLTRVTGTGPGGVITRDDLAASGASSASEQIGVRVAAGPATVRESRTPIKSLRKLTAAAMVQSAFTAPHVTEFLTIDVTATMDLLDSINRAGARNGEATGARNGEARVGVLAVVAQALCLAIARTPCINTRWDDASGEIIQFHYVNLGIAVATPRGLLVPVIADAERLTLAALAAALRDLAGAARSGTTTPAALAGGTITITNIGVFGIDAGTPILNTGEAAILAMGAIRRRPWEYHGEIALRHIMTLSLSFDHRLVDGEQGSRFLTDVGRVLADPGMVLTLLAR